MTVARELAILIAGSNQASPALQQLRKELEAVSGAAATAGSAGVKAGDHMHAGMGKASGGARALQSAMSGVGQSMLPMQVGMFGLGAAAAFMGASMAKGAFNAGVAYESAFAGVRKTVDATEEEFKQLSGSIRQMAKEIPSSREEIARVAEAAGQLGIKKEAIVEFTRTMSDLGATTNMSSDQAATALARLANITQMPQDQFGRLGSTVVDLGNKFAATESEIVNMSMRLAGAGHQIGLSEAQILAFGAALSSVGIEAEMGGSAFSRVMIEMASAVAMNNDRLKIFAQTAGMTADQFRRKFETDAAGALIVFVEGLARVKAEGGNVFETLDDLELGEIRVRDALLRASGAGDLFREALVVGNRAWEENIALTKEAEERYKTTAAKIDMMKNKWSDLAIDGFERSKPTIHWLIDRLGDLAEIYSRSWENTDKFKTAYAESDAALAASLPNLSGAKDAWNKLADAMGRLSDFRIRGVEGGFEFGFVPKAPAATGELGTPSGRLGGREIADFANEFETAQAKLQRSFRENAGVSVGPRVLTDEEKRAAEWLVKVRQDAAKAQEGLAKEREAEGKKAADDAKRLAEQTARDFRKVQKEIDEETGGSLIKLMQIGERAGEQWKEAWVETDAAIQRAYSDAKRAMEELDQQDILEKSIRFRRQAFAEAQAQADLLRSRRLQDQESERGFLLDLSRLRMDSFDQQMRTADLTRSRRRSDEDDLWMLNRELGKAKTEDEKKQIRDRFNDAREVLAYRRRREDEDRSWQLEQDRKALAQRRQEALADLAYRRGLEDDERNWRREQARALQDFEDMLAGEAMGRQKARILSERDAKITAINEEWKQKQANIDEETKKLIAAERESAAGRLTELKTEFLDKLAEAGAPGIAQFAALINSQLGGALAELAAMESRIDAARYSARSIEAVTSSGGMAGIRAVRGPTSEGASASAIGAAVAGALEGAQIVVSADVVHSALLTKSGRNGGLGW